ncbi:hypothetical protein D043_1618A, partial [Vibrio parahaemolyticus EKP-021]
MRSPNLRHSSSCSYDLGRLDPPDLYANQTLQRSYCAQYELLHTDLFG